MNTPFSYPALFYLAVDAVVFGYDDKTGVSVLLIRRKHPPYKDKWALPGGFVLPDETPEKAVKRELKEEAGIALNYMEQLYTFGDPKRDSRGRVVSVAYFGLVKNAAYQLHAATDATDARWFDVQELPPLAFDHDKMIGKALYRLRHKLHYEPIGFELLDEKFTFHELHYLYELMYGQAIDRRNFKKKFLQLGLLNELNEKRSEGKGRPATVYSFNEKKYQELTEKGIFLEF